MTLWQALFAIIGACVAIVGAIKLMLGGYLDSTQKMLEAQTKHIDEKLTAIKNANDGTAKKVQDLELDILRNYVRRDDWTRTVTSLTATIDRFRAAFDAYKDSTHAKRGD